MRVIIFALVVHSAALAQEAPVEEAPEPPAKVEPEDTRSKIYVLDPKVVDMAEGIGATISSALAQSIEKEGLRALTREDAKEVINQQGDLAVIGADGDPMTLSNLGKAIGAPHLLAVVATQAANGDIIFQGRMIDAVNIKVLVRRETRASDYDGEILTAIKELARLCLAPFFAHLNGTIALTCSEEGANVFVDDVQIGTTPIEPFEIAGGYHTVKLTKEGFIRFQKQVQPKKEDTLPLEVALKPSLEYMQKYRAEAELYRTVGFVSASAAVALVAVGAGFGVGYLVGLDGIKDIDDTLGDNERLAQLGPNCETAVGCPEKTALEEDRNDLAFQSQLFSVGGIAGAAVGIAAGAAATYFFVFGNNPDRYAEFE